MNIYLIRRIAYSFLLIYFALTLTFFIVNSMPGSPFDQMRKEMAERNPKFGLIPQAHWDRLNALVGLDKPVYERYFTWIRSALTGDLGDAWSVAWGQDVLTVILSRLPYTLLLTFSATLLSLAIAVPFGVYSAVRPYTTGDLYITIFSFFGLAMPSFVLGLFMISVFAYSLHWLPPSGAATVGGGGDIITVIARVLTLGLANSQIAGREGALFADGFWHLILPTLALTPALSTRWSRLLRASMLETLRQDYVRTARAKGVTYWGVLLKHCLPNSLIPLISAMALDIPMLLTGAFMVEIVFTWPGIGRLYIDSFRNGDWPTLMGIVVVSTYLIVFANLLADIAYGIVDPRIRKAA